MEKFNDSSDQASQARLSADIHLLGDILGQVIRRQAGLDIFELEEVIRALPDPESPAAEPL